MLWAAGAFALCMLVCLPLFMRYKRQMNYRLAASYKAIGTLCAAALALTAAIRLDPRCWICFAGILLHATADWFLEFNIFVGTGLFMAGHICYIAFFTQLVPPGPLHLICTLILIAVTAYMFFRWRKEIGKIISLYAVYGGILCLMSGCAIACLSAGTLQGQLIAAGGALFYISDAMICARQLFTADRSVDWTIMILYYMAQFLISFSCLMM